MPMPQQKATRARLSIIDCTLNLAHHSRVDAELLCPACRIPLTELRTGNGVIWRCEKCDGCAVGLHLLRRTFTAESINPLGCTRSTTKEEAPALVHPAETLCLRSPSTAAAESRSKSVEFVNSSGSMPAKHKGCKRDRCRNQNRRLSCRKKRARQLHWRKFSNSPSKRAARISIARHPTNGGNRLQLFSGCRWNLTRPQRNAVPQ